MTTAKIQKSITYGYLGKIQLTRRDPSQKYQETIRAKTLLNDSLMRAEETRRLSGYLLSPRIKSDMALNSTCRRRTSLWTKWARKFSRKRTKLTFMPTLEGANQRVMVRFQITTWTASFLFKTKTFRIWATSTRWRRMNCRGLISNRLTTSL